MPSLVLTIAVLVCVPPVTFGAQNQDATVRVQVRASEKPVEDAEVVVAGTTHRTDAAGATTIITVPGPIEITVLETGLRSGEGFGAGGGRRVPVSDIVELHAQLTVEETVTVVASTRTDKRLEDQPMRVEVLAREEIEEKMLMTPGDIVMMLNEMGGMRVQATSPSLGAASVRIQGMRGRYTRVLSDGLPLFGEVGGLGLLQIPPMDLGQVEVIKGVTSALYGAGAMGGVVNLLSRRPGREHEQEFLLNRSTRGATDAVTFLSGPLSRGWSASLLGGGHFQETNDVNDDAWADLPGYGRAVVRPRVFWDGGNGRTFFATTGFTYEDREGGTPPDQVLAATGRPYVEAPEPGVRRQRPRAVLFKGCVVTARAAVARQSHDHQFCEVIERDRRDTASAEAVRGTAAGRPGRGLPSSDA
jgi:iron complex outermembrane receptor protein